VVVEHQSGASLVRTTVRFPEAPEYQRAIDNTCKQGGAEGIRTPGLLDANEARYQLRHSP